MKIVLVFALAMVFFCRSPEEAGATTAISAVIQDYQSYTCIRFKRYYSKPSGPHLFFTDSNGCSSPVGRRRFGNSIKLSPGCWRKGTIMHEIGHSLGLFHEQSRPDRDSYVTIMWDNIGEESENTKGEVVSWEALIEEFCNAQH